MALKDLVASVRQKSPRARLSSLEDEIETKQRQRDQLITERRQLAVQNAEGDADAMKKYQRLGRDIADCGDLLSALHDARSQLAEVVAAEDDAKAGRAERERLAAVEVSWKDWHAKATAVSLATDDLLTALCDFRTAGNVVWENTRNNSEMGGHLADLNLTVPSIIDARLAESGYAFKTITLGNSKPLAQRLMDIPRVMFLAQEKKA